MKGICPICAGNIDIDHSVEITEIIICGECQNKLEVKNINEKNITLVEAPKIEEDWGQ